MLRNTVRNHIAEPGYSLPDPTGKLPMERRRRVSCHIVAVFSVDLYYSSVSLVKVNSDMLPAWRLSRQVGKAREASTFIPLCGLKG